jgi:DNA-binding transcriptional LysR family regulator
VPWLLRKSDGSIAEVVAGGRVRVTDDVLGVVSAARAGLGIAQVYRFTVEQQLASGELVEVLPKLAGAARPFSLLYPKHRHMAQRARLLIDYLVEELRRAA